MQSAMVSGYKKNLNVIAFVKLIQRLTGESLGPAKSRVDSLLAQQSFELSFANEAAADEFLRAATDIGAIVER
jgi:hypothetical protein